MKKYLGGTLNHRLHKIEWTMNNEQVIEHVIKKPNVAKCTDIYTTHMKSNNIKKKYSL